MAHATVITFGCTLTKEMSDGITYAPPSRASYDTVNVELDLVNSRAWDSLSGTWHSMKLTAYGWDKWCDHAIHLSGWPLGPYCMDELSYVPVTSLNAATTPVPLLFDLVVTALATATTSVQTENRAYSCSPPQALQG